MRTIQLLILATVSLVFGTSAFGQASKFEVGVEAGPTLGAARGHWIIETFDPAIRYSGGLSLQYNHTNALSFRTNLAFERKSVVAVAQMIDEDQYPYPTSKRSRKSYFHFDYLTIPLLARWNFGDRIRYFVNAGPYVAYLIKHQFVYHPYGSTDYPKQSDRGTHNYNRLDAGVSTGLGVSLPLHEKVKLNLEVRNNLGLVKINKNENLVDTRLNSTSLLLGLAYPL